MSNRHQKPAPVLVHDQFRGKRLRAALLEVSGALRCRPEPREAWDDLARADRELRSLWIDKDVDLCRAALTAAASEGPGILAATRQRVERFFAEKCKAALYGHESLTTDLSSEIVEMTRETSQVMVAAAEAQHEPNERALEQLRSEGFEAIAEINDVIELASARLSKRSAVPALVRT